MTFLCSATFTYDVNKIVAGLSDDAYQELRSKVRSDAKNMLPKVRCDKEPNLVTYTPHIMDDVEADAWTSAGVKLEMSRIRGVASQSPRLDQVVYQISVANVGLMQVQSVTVEEDCCTDHLQDMLDKGWRILAVCPPNDTRRPSYVLGHMEKGV